MKTATPPTRQRSRITSSGIRPGNPKAPGIKISNVLVPIDFSEPSLRAIEFALPLVKRFGAELHFVHVFEPDHPIAGMVAMPLVVPEPEVGRRVRRHLKDVAARYSVSLRPQNIHALKGRPFEEICRLAQGLGIDLIVTSTRGQTGMKHLLLGSTAERVVRYAPCPVLVVHPAQSRGKKVKSELSFGKIMVPIDFSECAMKGLAYAKALAGEFSSKLVLLHSVAPQYYVTNDEYARYDFA